MNFKPLVISLLVCLLTACTTPAVRKETAEDMPDLSEKNLLDQVGASAKNADEAIRQGDAAARAGNDDLAVVLYVKALDLDPNNTTAPIRLGTLYERLGKTGLAVTAYQMVLGSAPKHAEANEKMGLLLLKNRNHEEARKFLQQSLEINNKRWRAHNALGVLADIDKQHADAVEHYHAAIEINPNSAILQNNLGYSLYLTGQTEAAEKHFKTALSLDGGFERARNNLALVQARKRNYDEAFKAFSQSMDVPTAYNNVGYICMLEGDYALAERYFQMALKNSPIYFPKADENLKHVQSLLNR